MPRASNLIKKSSFITLALLFCVVSFAAAQSNTAKLRSRSGTIVYSSCNADEAFAESPECMKAAPGDTLALYDDTNRVMYSLEPQNLITGYLGKSVTVQGTLDVDTNTMHVTSIGPMSIGLEVGQKAPSFSLPDQFGRTQTLDSLKGSNGTVLLLFRSADW